jgi:hypothetical protein
MTCRTCGLRVAETRFGLGHIERLPRGRGHYVRLQITAAPLPSRGSDATVNGGPEDSQEAFPVSPRSRGVRRSSLAKAG